MPEPSGRVIVREPSETVSDDAGNFRGISLEEWLTKSLKTPSGQVVRPLPSCTILDINVGDNGNGCRAAVLVECPRCGSFAITLAREDGPGKHIDKDLITKIMAKGWRMGKKLSKILCPKCVEIEINERQEKMNGKIVAIKSAEIDRAHEHATKQRALTRKVHETIEQYYPVPEKGYANGGSDEVVSKKTGASLEFVCRERDKMFGPASVIDVKSIEIKIANMERVIKECEEKALAAMERADVEIRAARAMVADLKERL